MKNDSKCNDEPNEPPYPPGNYLEPYYHFYFFSEPNTMFKTIPKVFSSLMNNKVIPYAMDWRVIPRKFQVRCQAYPEGEKLEFICRIYFAPEAPEAPETLQTGGQKYVFEIQRRSGSVISFSNLWQKCKNIFQKGGNIASVNTVIPKTNLPQMLLPYSITHKEIRKSLLCIYRMAHSPYYDVQIQAMSVLLQKSLEQEYKPLMIEDQYLNILLEGIQHSQEEIHRCAVSTLGNLLVDYPHLSSKIRNQTLVNRLQTFLSSKTKEIVRQTSRLLSFLE